MSATGRPERESLSAQREGSPSSATGRPERESPGAQREGSPSSATGRPERESPGAQREGRPSSAPAFLGDEVTAAGYRLAGLDVRSPLPGAETAALAQARASAPLVLVSAACALRVDDTALREALRALSPVVVIVADAHGDVAPPDLAARLRGQLGLEA